jgi:hypothetical protein
MKVILSRSLTVLLVLLLSFSTQAVIEVKANFFLIPHINVKQPENTTYNSNSVPLSIVWSSAYWSEDVQICYSLDGGEMVMVGNGSTSKDALAPVYWHNSTLHNLSNETHLISVYAIDAIGNHVPDMSHLLMSTTEISFTVEQITPEEPIQFPLAVVTALIGVVIVVGLGILAYFKKRRS